MRKPKMNRKLPYRAICRNGEVLSILIMEYNNFHKEVVQTMQSLRNTTIQALVAFGALLFFSINRFYSIEDKLFVDTSMFVLLPMIAMALIYVALTTQIRILAYGEYLISIEKRINNHCENKGMAEKEIIGWEKWQRENGILRDPLVSNDGTFIFLLILISASLAILFRGFYIVKCANDGAGLYSFGELIVWMVVLSFIITFMIHFYIKLSKKMICREKEINKLLSLETAQTKSLFIKLLNFLHNNSQTKLQVKIMFVVIFLAILIIEFLLVVISCYICH